MNSLDKFRKTKVAKIAKILLLLLILFGLMYSFLFLRKTAFHKTHPLLVSNSSLLVSIPFSQAVYDNKRQLLRLTLSRDDKYRLYTPLDQIAPQVIEATLLQEDQYFYWHFGVNPIALTKAFWKTYVLHSRRIGASTITMQTARLFYHINTKTWSGKLWQIACAIRLEFLYSKHDILEAYLNLAPYGNNIEGVGAASLVYFSKPANELNLIEGLTLVVMPQHPARHVIGNGSQQILEARQDLWQRWCIKHPKDKNKTAMLALPLPKSSVRQLPFLAPHLVDNILQMQSPQNTINTFIDLNWQNIVEKVTHSYLQRKKNLDVFNAVVMVVDTRNMAIKAMLGSADFWRKDIDGQVNGTTMRRSPGSTLKPFIYALAQDQGLIHPATILKDVPTSFADYDPENFDKDFLGPVSAKNALILSRNIPAIDLANKLHDPTLYQFLQRAEIGGLKSENSYGLSMVLGGAEVNMQELVTLYAMLENGGIWRPLRLQQSDLLLPGKKLLSPEASFLVLDMLKDAPRPTGFTQTMLDKRKIFIAWKTGTSSAYRDAWTLGYVGPYVVAVWLGDFKSKSNPALVGKEIAAPLFFNLVEALGNVISDKDAANVLPNPANLHLAQVPICKASGMLPTRYCQDTILSWFIPGKSPITKDNIYREVAIDKKTGLRVCSQFGVDTDFAIYEFWPSDLLKLWQAAGIKRQLPPPFAPGCGAAELAGDSAGMAPQITSPRAAMQYVISLGRTNNLKNSGGNIPLEATVDADVKTVYWFVDKTYVGNSAGAATLWWAAQPGKFVVRAIDDRGRTAAVNIEVVVAASQ